MGNCNTKKKQKEPDEFFAHKKWEQDKHEEKIKKNLNPINKRDGTILAPIAAVPGTPRSVPVLPPTLAPIATARTYDDEAIDTMRFQLNNDCDAFLLNNILLGVQFFENYERENSHIKNNPMSDSEHRIDEAMVRHHKHVFFPDRLQDCVHEHVRFVRRKGILEPLHSPRLFVIYDNIEASEPGDTSDYSTVLDAPFYKLQIEDCKEAGYTKLKKLEILESSATNKEPTPYQDQSAVVSDDSVYTNSEKEVSEEDDFPSNGEQLLHKVKSRFQQNSSENIITNKNINNIINKSDLPERRRSGPTKQLSSVAVKANISNMNYMRRMSVTLEEESERRTSIYNIEKPDINTKVTTGILKNSNKNKQIEQNNVEDVGYKSNSSRNNESSETESDYGYATITASTTPRRVELSITSNVSVSSGVLSDECWAILKVRNIDQSTDEDDDDDDNNIPETTSKTETTRKLYYIEHYLDSINFMTNFIDNFMVKLGSAIGLTSDAVKNALTQGASIYCDSTGKASNKFGYEIIPAILAAWPSVANQWIIRERKVIVSPRTNLTYLWPTKDMIKKTMNLGCLLIPIGFRPKRGSNTNQKLQWKIIFPAAEKFLESNLAHSHIRCYLFTLTLFKTFIESESFKMGIDASHIKNHLFWMCEENYAGWPEDRLGESLRLFLKRFYDHFGRSKLPNYFVDTCNEFKGIPTPVLLKLQRRFHDILQAPVMHLLSAISKLKYTSKDFYPQLNVNKLYLLLTCKNPLRLVNPNLPPIVRTQSSSDSDQDENNKSVFERAKTQDKYYQWKVARRQAQERRKANINAKKNKVLPSVESTIDRNIILPPKMDVERRRLVLEFFIPHFISMARYSEKFEATKQAVIYLEQAQRLSKLLQEEPGGDTTANEYIDIIRDDLAECHRKLINQSGYKLPNRRESTRDINRRLSEIKPTGRQRPKFSNLVNQDSPTDSPGIAPFTFVDVHPQASTSGGKSNLVKLVESDSDSEEESRL